VAITPNRRSLLIVATTTTLGASGCASRGTPEDVKRYIVERSQEWTQAYCVFRTNVTARFGIVTDHFGSVTGRSGDVTAGVFVPA
jgi:hypothetical protein